MFSRRCGRGNAAPIPGPSDTMKPVLALCRAIDALNERVGRAVYWLVLAAVIVSAGTAFSRYAFSVSSNAWLELQWYLFSLVFLLAAGYTLRHDGHVRVDVLYSRLSSRARAAVDVLGGLTMLLPMTLLIAWLSWHTFQLSFEVREMSPDAGGLPRWPVKLAVPLGFALLALQGVSETVKRIAFLAGAAPPPEPPAPPERP
jgi:TRAP-type mannitol/chloroaromatic compound transport system permease small subunit